MPERDADAGTGRELPLSIREALRRIGADWPHEAMKLADFMQRGTDMLFDQQATIRQMEREREAGVDRVASLVESLEADPDGETDNDLMRLDLIDLWDAFAPGRRALSQEEVDALTTDPGGE